jgi:hypothetical protein
VEVESFCGKEIAGDVSGRSRKHNFGSRVPGGIRTT